MNHDLVPLSLIKALRYALVVLALATLFVWERGNTQRPAEKFQGGIAQPDLYSSPSPVSTNGLKAIGATPTPKVGSGSLIIEVVDQNLMGAPGIPVQITGAVSISKKSDPEGKVHLSGPAGYYNFKIDAGCTADIQILSSASGRGGIAEGQTGKGKMQIEWRHRYRPWHPSFSSLTPFWPVGESVNVGFYVADRCDEMERVPGARFPTFAFVPSSNLQIDGNPSLEADGQGHGYVRVRCISPGRVTLLAVDKANPSDDRLDLLDEDISSGSRPECR